jgi:hypothetical protein
MNMTTDILFDEQQANADAELQAEDRQRKLQAAYTQVFLTTEAGRDVLVDLLTWSKSLETTMTGNSWTHYNEGARAVGLKLLKMLGLGGVDHLVALLAKDAGHGS